MQKGLRRCGGAQNRIAAVEMLPGRSAEVGRFLSVVQRPRPAVSD